MMTLALRRWLAILATGFTFVFFSELLFWGTPSLPQFLMTWGVYTLLAYAFLLLVEWFHVNTLPSLFLAGAIYGWLTEGVIVSTLYEALPQSISDTGLSWHALITVCLGWYGLRRALRAPGLRPVVLWSITVGLLTGLWLPLWGVEQAAGIAPFTLTRLALLLGTAVPALLLSAWVQTAVPVAPLRPPRIELLLLLACLLVFFVAGILPVYPLAALVLPALLLVALLGLRAHRQTVGAAPSLLVELAGAVSPSRLLPILLIIPAALLAFAISERTGLAPYPSYLLYALTIPAGFLLFALSLYKIWRARAANKKLPAI